MSNFQIHELTSGTIDRDSNVIHDTLNGGNYETRKATAGAVADLANVNVAALYDPDTTYAIGQYCLYEGNVYRCIAITTGAFDSTAWVQIVVTGEFRRVVELTSAQYSALSSAEKNNGTLYILTDEETTADDIPYSQGVSVADMLNVSNNITLNEGTLYSTYVNNKFDYYYNQYGKLVLFTLDFEMKARSGSSGWGEIFKTSSPISLKNSVIVSCISSLNNWNRVRINSNGTIDLNLVSNAASTERVSIQIIALLI